MVHLVLSDVIHSRLTLWHPEVFMLCGGFYRTFSDSSRPHMLCITADSRVSDTALGQRHNCRCIKTAVWIRRFMTSQGCWYITNSNSKLTSGGLVSSFPDRISTCIISSPCRAHCLTPCESHTDKRTVLVLCLAKSFFPDDSQPVIVAVLPYSVLLAPCLHALTALLPLMNQLSPLVHSCDSLWFRYRHVLLSIVFQVCLFFWISFFQVLWISIARLVGFVRAWDYWAVTIHQSIYLFGCKICYVYNLQILKNNYYSTQV